MLFRLSDVTKSYGGTEVLRGVSFQINPGDHAGLVGRNGAGKTTVFRLITGKESAETGSIIRMNSLKLGLLDQHVDFEKGETVHVAALSAFKEIHDMEREMRLLEKEMETNHSAEVLGRYADLQHAFELADGFSYAARAEAVLLGLGFERDSWNLSAETLSGGQKTRLGMVRLLLSGADVLLLDEPTNHLDVGAVEWLENFLAVYEKSYVVISHDRYFLDRTTNRIIEIDRGRAVTYTGNYSHFVTEREVRREQQQREYENQQAMIVKTEEFIRRNLEGQKTKQAKSRRNMLERIKRFEAVTAERSGGNFKLKNVERTGNNVLTTEEVVVGYGDKKLAENINLSLHRGEVLGIIGGNGSGKTTFLKTVLGRLPALAGTVQWGTKTDIGYYAQNLEDLEPRNEVIAELRRVAPLAESGELRAFLARFLFEGEDVFKSVGDLSGGEKGRLALAKLIYSLKNVLILDEPTNHLDIPSREALEQSLVEYDGTIIAVSHDRFFLDKIATQILAFRDDGLVDVYNGNYSQYHAWFLENSQTCDEPPKPENGDLRGPEPEVRAADAQRLANQSSERDASKLSKNQRDRITADIEKIEKEISRLEAAHAELSGEMCLPEIASNFTALRELTAKSATIESKIKRLYERWEAETEKLK